MINSLSTIVQIDTYIVQCISYILYVLNHIYIYIYLQTQNNIMSLLHGVLKNNITDKCNTRRDEETYVFLMPFYCWFVLM